MSKSFFFGFVTVYDWEWLWGRTAAQIELRTIDQPIVVYKADKDNDKPWKNGTVSESYANKQYQKWLEKKKKRESEGKSIDVGKVFHQGKRINLGHFLDTGEKREI